MRVAVIGAGISGIRTCESLLRRGCSVTLLESASGPTQGLSYAPGFLGVRLGFSSRLLYEEVLFIPKAAG